MAIFNSYVKLPEGNSQLKVLMNFASQLPPRLVQHQRLEEQGADLVATGLTKLGCAISFGSQMDDYTMLHGIQNGHHFSSFLGDLCTFDTNMWTEWNFPRRASHIEFCATSSPKFVVTLLPIRYLFVTLFVIWCCIFCHPQIIDLPMQRRCLDIQTCHIFDPARECHPWGTLYCY